MKIVFNKVTKIFSVSSEENKYPNEIEMTIWGRKFKLKVIYSIFNDEEPEDFPVMAKAIEEFQKRGTKLLDKCKKDVEEMCVEENNYWSDNKITKVDNIFKYIIPTDVVVSYDNRKPNDRLIALSCNFKFDTEHGRYILFCNDEYMGCGNLDIPW